MKITNTSDKIKVEGHKGTWYVIDSSTYRGETVYLLEHEQYGDEAASIIVDENGELIAEDIWNGFDDLDDWYDIDALDADSMWDILKEYCGVEEQTLQVVCNINGYSEDTMKDILYAVTGYRNFEQAQEEYGYDLRAYC